MNSGSLLLAEDGRLRPIWRFFAGLAVLYIALNLSPLATIPFRDRSLIVRELVSRCALTLLLAGGFSLLLVALDGIETRPLAAMGLPFRRSALRDGVLGIMLGAGMVTMAVVAIAIWGQLSLSTTFQLPGVIKPLVAVTVMLALAAISEELAFRGYPFQRLVEAVGATGSVAVTSALFAAAHFANPHATRFAVLNTAAVGVLFALAYLKTKSLWVPWGMHFGWNFMLGVAFGLPVSGIDRFSVITHGTAAGPAWLTGGDYGIEASATATAVIIVGIIVVAFLFPSRTVGQKGVPASAAEIR
jgi:membrane protease YdiL (CAAX protease family)